MNAITRNLQRRLDHARTVRHTQILVDRFARTGDALARQGAARRTHEAALDLTRTAAGRRVR